MQANPVARCGQPRCAERRLCAQRLGRDIVWGWASEGWILNSSLSSGSFAEVFAPLAEVFAPLAEVQSLTRLVSPPRSPTFLCLLPTCRCVGGGVVLLPSGNERLTAAFNVTTDAASQECGVGGLPSYVRELRNSSAVTVVSMRLYAVWVTDPSLYDRFVALVVTVECFPNASDPGVARRVLLPLVHFHQPAPHIADPRGGELSWLHWLLIGVAVASCVVVGLVVVCFVRRRRGAARGHVLETRKPPWVPSVSRRCTPLVGHPWRQLWTLLAPTRSLRLTSPTTW